MKVLYVSGSSSDGISVPMEELAQISPVFDVHGVAGAAAALVEIRTTGGYDTLFTAPDLPHNEALALIASLRRDRVPIAIVAIAAETQEDFLAPVITAGADDVLLMREGTLISPEDTARRIRESRYLKSEDELPGLRVLYAGDDDLTWDLLQQTPFIEVEHTTCASDGTCSLVMPGPEDGMVCDAILIDEHPGEAHPLLVVKAIKAQHPDVTVVVLTSPTGADIGGAALDLGADDAVSKAGVYRRRLVGALHRIYVKRNATSRSGAATRAPREDGAADGRLGAAREDWDAERQSLEERLRELEALEQEYHTLVDGIGLLRTENSALTEALAFERTLREQDRTTLASAEDALLEERTRREALDFALRQTEERAAADLEALRAERASEPAADDTLASAREAWESERQGLEERLREVAALEQEYHTLVDSVGLLRTENAALTEALGFERALRERDRTELETARQSLADERARREVLDVTLRQTEERAGADLAALRSEQAHMRRSLEDRLALASERLHAVANETQALQTRLENEIASRAEAHDRLSQCDLFGHALMRRDGTLVRCNDAFARMFGYADAREAIEFAGRDPFPGTAGRPELDAQLAAEGHVSGVTSLVRHVDGRHFHVLESATLLPASDGHEPLVERVFVEATDRARIDAELRLARRLEAAGRLAAEVAPEIESSLVALETSSGATAVDRHRATALIRQLLAFARRQSQPAGFLSLNDAIHRLEPLLRRIAGEYTDFQIRLAPDLDAIAAGEPDIEQLLTSLVFAASALLPMGGSITMETLRAEAAPEHGTGALLLATASGYALRPPALPDMLELAATRCGGHASLTTDDDRSATFRIVLR